jgi:hypothetical protein
MKHKKYILGMPNYLNPVTGLTAHIGDEEFYDEPGEGEMTATSPKAILFSIQPVLDRTSMALGYAPIKEFDTPEEATAYAGNNSLLAQRPELLLLSIEGIIKRKDSPVVFEKYEPKKKEAA